MSKKKQPRAYSEMEYLDYELPMSDKDKAWAERFFKEYYDNAIYDSKENIIQSEEMLKEARRNYNNLKRDALMISNRDVAQEYRQNHEFLEDASDEWEWRDAFKVGGFELASHTIFEHTIRDLENGTEWKPILARMFVKMQELLRLKRRDDVNKNKGEKS